MSNIFRKTWVSPVGELHLYADSEHLLALAFDANDQALQKKLGLEEATQGEVGPIQQTEAQLREYFAGDRKEFDLPLLMRGTDFQLQAWKALRAIPYGTCVSYTSQAASMDKAAAIRAVGAANGQNPYSIVVPCHRVIGKNGKLTGYAGGEEVKEALLRLEGYLK